MTFHPAGGIGTDPGVPAPPPGPGAAPPFAAPPTDRDKRRMWIMIGVGGLVLVLCAVGGVFGIGVLLVSGTEQVKRQATGVVGDYLDALLDSDYALARRQYCGALAARVSQEELARNARSSPFTSYELGEPAFADTVEVPATLRTTGGRETQLFQLDTSGSRLCILNIGSR